MCGFVGGNKLQSKDELSLCLNKIIHRGKDYTGVFQDGEVFLGHNRLSIQDTSENANQPFVSNSGDTVIVYSGELWDGYQELKSQLLTDYNFRTNSDTEVILALYEKYGVESFKKLDGMFSFVIYDKRQEILLLVRDRIGKIPFYYFSDSNSKIIFSNEMKAFSQFSDIRDKSYLVMNVTPGTYIHYDLKTRKFHHDTYYSLPYSQEYGGEYDLKDSPEVIATNIRKKLEIAVKKRLISDAPICVLLSGGIDSVVTTYLAKKFIPNIEAFTVSIGDTRKKDDLHYARIAAKEFGIPLHEVILDKDTFIDELDNTIYAIEDSEWTQLSTAIVQIPLARKIGDAGFKVAIGGEGSDEVFASYADVQAYSYKSNDYHKKRKKLIDNLHATNLRRTNCAMLFGGTVEMRSPFLDKDFLEYAINIPAHFAWKINDNNKKREKPFLRQAFKGEISDELLYRKKVPTGEGAHSQATIKEIYERDKDFFSKRLDRLLFPK